MKGDVTPRAPATKHGRQKFMRKIDRIPFGAVLDKFGWQVEAALPQDECTQRLCGEVVPMKNRVP
ncbi:hypothetical protein X727_08000 [Mesorhizobium sp. L103C119B0]|nr:hypothetical protein X727_08000 [Mesorhizobium sp. L103C119B0]